ncbi:MAG TPA: Rv3235 family protein [Actinomycetales bacterium]|nr:Rv3235 family protein [Actinomycetales bacterium]
MQTAVLDPASKSQSLLAPNRKTGLEPAQVRRLPTLAKRALVPSTSAQCCGGACGMDAPEVVAEKIARAAQEVINGARPLKQLTRWLTAEAFEGLEKRLSIQRRKLRPSQRAVNITSRRVCRVNHDTVEAAVVLSDGGRIRAAVVRLEAFRGRWRATYLQTL